jgi:hypothetical protein
MAYIPIFDEAAFTIVATPIAPAHAANVGPSNLGA